MNFKKLYKHLVLLTLMVSCVEEFPLVTESFEDILVIEATITDELKTQVIKLSRTTRLESDVLIFENNAKVSVVANSSTTYIFNDVGDGLYESNQQFKAEEGTEYKLFVETSGGDLYESNVQILAPKSEIDDLYPRLINNGDQAGVQVLVDSKVNSSNPGFFRYEYEETYKIVAPIFSFFDLEFTSTSGSGETFRFTSREVLRPLEQQTCYSSNVSSNILITSINGLTEQSVSEFPVRFIAIDDAIIRVRYSILVRQFTQSADANNFYKILKELGSDESLLIDSQPGFIQGNIFSNQSLEKKVFGFFDVSSVASKRIYFSYENFDIDRPPYFFDCDVLTINIGTPSERARLYRLLNDEGYKYLGQDISDYFIVNPPCGDCTSFSSSIKPDFWED